MEPIQGLLKALARSVGFRIFIKKIKIKDYLHFLSLSLSRVEQSWKWT